MSIAPIWGHYFLSNPIYSLCPYHGYLTILFLFEFSTTKHYCNNIFRSILQSCNNLSVVVFFHFYILSYFFTTPILQQFFCFKYVFSGSIHGRLILVPPEFMSTNSPHSSSFSCICISRFFSSSQPGNIRKMSEKFLSKMTD